MGRTARRTYINCFICHCCQRISLVEGSGSWNDLGQLPAHARVVFYVVLVRCWRCAQSENLQCLDLSTRDWRVQYSENVEAIARGLHANACIWMCHSPAGRGVRTVRDAEAIPDIVYPIMEAHILYTHLVGEFIVKSFSGMSQGAPHDDFFHQGQTSFFLNQW